MPTRKPVPATRQFSASDELIGPAPPKRPPRLHVGIGKTKVGELSPSPLICALYIRGVGETLSVALSPLTREYLGNKKRGSDRVVREQLG
jgi:hypothetical protein